MEKQKSTFIVRNISQEIQAGLSRVATEQKISREQLIRTILAQYMGIENTVRTRKYNKGQA